MACSLGMASFWLPGRCSYEAQVNNDRATAVEAVLVVTQLGESIDNDTKHNVQTDRCDQNEKCNVKKDLFN